MKPTSEEAFETLLVEPLTGHDYLARPNTDYDADLAILVCRTTGKSRLGAP